MGHAGCTTEVEPHISIFLHTMFKAGVVVDLVHDCTSQSDSDSTYFAFEKKKERFWTENVLSIQVERLLLRV